MNTIRPFRHAQILLLGTLVLLAAPHTALGTPTRNPAITAPRQSPPIGNPRLSIRWTGVRGAKSYKLRIRESGTSALLVDQTLTTSSYAFDLKAAGLLGGRIEIFVQACSGSNGTDCYSNTTPPSTSWGSKVSPYVAGVPVVMTAPANGSTYNNPNRRPTFSWQAYSGFRPSGSLGSLQYRVTIIGNGGAPKIYSGISGTSFTPPANDPIPDYFQNPVRWSVQAYNSYNYSGSGGTRSLTLSGSDFPTLTGPVILYQPASGTAVNDGAQLKWNTLTGAVTYKICLNTQPNGCLGLYDQAAQSGSIQTFTLTKQILDAGPPFGAKYYRGKTIYWSVGACNQGNTACTTATPQWRIIQVAAESPGGGGGGTGGTPQVSFAAHLYPVITTACAACHPGGANPQYFPQKTPNLATNCPQGSIPFATSITASDMLSRFKCLKASSTQSVYSQAYNKIYVVPGSHAQSGLHYKAQASSAPIFSQQTTIDGVTKPLKEWITIWIDQGANP